MWVRPDPRRSFSFLMSSLINLFQVVFLVFASLIMTYMKNKKIHKLIFKKKNSMVGPSGLTKTFRGTIVILSCVSRDLY